MEPFVTFYLDEIGFHDAKEQAVELDKIVGREVSIGLSIKDSDAHGWINVHTRDEDVIRRVEDHFAGHIVEICRSWLSERPTKKGI